MGFHRNHLLMLILSAHFALVINDPPGIKQKIIWKKHRCDVQNVRRRHFSVIFLLLWTFYFLSEVKDKADTVTDKDESQIWHCFVLGYLVVAAGEFCNKVSSPDMCCVSGTESCWITAISLSKPGDSCCCSGEEVTYKTVNQLNAGCGV